MLRPLFAILILGTAVACSDAGSNHAAQSVHHSESSVMHGSASVGDGVSTAVAVPLMVSGASLLVTGAAVQSSTTNPTPPLARTPNGPPAL